MKNVHLENSFFLLEYHLDHHRTSSLWLVAHLGSISRNNLVLVWKNKAQVTIYNACKQLAYKMGFSSGTSTEWLLVHWFPNWNFTSWFLWGEENWRKTLEAQERTNKQLYSHTTPCSVGFEPWSHWWEVNALTAMAPLLPLCLHGGQNHQRSIMAISTKSLYSPKVRL